MTPQSEVDAWMRGYLAGYHDGARGNAYRGREPIDITEEPPRGSQVTDRSGDVWERREEGWALWWPERSGWLSKGELDLWPGVRSMAPLRPTTDADRKRVGLPTRRREP